MNNVPQDHDSAEQRELDAALEDSFPASDPPSTSNPTRGSGQPVRPDPAQQFEPPSQLDARMDRPILAQEQMSPGPGAAQVEAQPDVSQRLASGSTAARPRTSVLALASLPVLIALATGGALTLAFGSNVASRR